MAVKYRVDRMVNILPNTGLVCYLDSETRGFSVRFSYYCDRAERVMFPDREQAERFITAMLLDHEGKGEIAEALRPYQEAHEAAIKAEEQALKAFNDALAVERNKLRDKHLATVIT